MTVKLKYFVTQMAMVVNYSTLQKKHYFVFFYLSCLALLNPYLFFQLYLYEAVARLMAGANPTETHHLLQRSTLRQRVVTSHHHKGHQPEDAGIHYVIANDRLLISHCHLYISSSGQVMRIKTFM